jgi:CRP-like cAMP-binding protein
MHGPSEVFRGFESAFDEGLVNHHLRSDIGEFASLPRLHLLPARLALSYDELAQLMGTTRETITRTLSEFRKKDIVELKGCTLIIHNKPALEQLVAS